MRARSHCPQYFKENFRRNNTIRMHVTRQSNLLHPPVAWTEIAKRSINMVEFFLWNFVFIQLLQFFFYLYIVFNHDQYQCNVYMYIVDLYIVVLRLPLITD